MEDLLRLLRTELFRVGDSPVTPASIGQFVLVILLVALLGRLTRRLLRDRVLTRTSLDHGLRDAIGRIAGYVVLVLGLMVALSTLGLDLSSLAVIGGALGVGLGFGLQNIVENFVSGLIILFERPITVGQRVEVGGTTGLVIRIGARSTTIVTNANITYIIPNSEFVTGRVINWSHGNDTRVRLAVPVGVAYGSDPRQIERILQRVARDNQDVMADPGPVVIFEGFGDSSMDFELRVWSATLSGRPKVLRSQLNFAIWDGLKEAGIEIPFPQRDLHVKGPLRVEFERAGV